MKTIILGIAVICLVLIAGVYAFGPHTRLDRNMVDCVYYSGPGNSCLVEPLNCNEDGTNRYVMFDETECLYQPSEARAAAAMPAQQVPPVLPAQPVAAQPAETAVYQSYLWLLIPMLLIFAVAVILLLLFLESRGQMMTMKHSLSSARYKKNVCNVALDKEKHKKHRAYCPRDGAAMKISGSLKQGPRGGQRQTYVCPKCNHRTMKTVKP